MDPSTTQAAASGLSPGAPNLQIDDSDEHVTGEVSQTGFLRRMMNKARASFHGATKRQVTREAKVKSMVKEMIIYVPYIIIICFVAFFMISTDMYYYTKVISDLFLDTKIKRDNITTWKSFRTMAYPKDIWQFIDGVLLPGIYNTQEPGLVGYVQRENKLVGEVRLRQLRVKNESCEIPEEYREVIRECFEAFSEDSEDRAPYGPQHSAWTYRDKDDLGSLDDFQGEVSVYPPGGFVQDLPVINQTQAELLVQALKDGDWIDRATRVLFIDFSLYNANINLFCLVKLIAEFPATGGLVTSWNIRSLKLIRYVSVVDMVTLVSEIIFVLYTIFFICLLIRQVYKSACGYLREAWFYMELTIITCNISCIILALLRYVKVVNSLPEIMAVNPQQEYAQLEPLARLQLNLNRAIAVALFLAWIKIFKYISVNKTMRQLNTTLARSARDILGFSVMFLIVFCAFAQFGYIVFGSKLRDFSRFSTSAFTLLRIILGDFDFYPLSVEARLLGPLFFCFYIFFVFFVMFNMFLAIINDTYSEVKAEEAQQKREFEISDYFKKGCQKIMSKLLTKRDKIMDMQKALEGADANRDKMLDFEEWRQELKSRGYTDAEIETTFAKYDTDGDRQLNEEEKLRMIHKLQAERAGIDEELMAVAQHKALGTASALEPRLQRLEEMMRRMMGTTGMDGGTLSQQMGPDGAITPARSRAGSVRSLFSTKGNVGV